MAKNKHDEMLKKKKKKKKKGRRWQRQFAGVATVITNTDSVSSSFKIRK